MSIRPSIANALWRVAETPAVETSSNSAPLQTSLEGFGSPVEVTRAWETIEEAQVTSGIEVVEMACGSPLLMGDLWK